MRRGGRRLDKEVGRSVGGGSMKEEEVGCGKRECEGGGGRVWEEGV